MSSLFFSYCHVGEGLCDQLEFHLAMLKRQEILSSWYDRRIAAGDELDAAIGERNETNDIIMRLVNPDSWPCATDMMVKRRARWNAMSPAKHL